MIQKIRVAKRQPSELEKWFSDIDPNWRGKNLHKWQYGGDNQTNISSAEVYNLKGFDKKQEGPLTMYQKGNKFLIEAIEGPFTNVLTNIKPPTEKKGLYNPKQKATKIVLGQNKLI